jgi:SAM-dependent methyltransferase
MTGRSVQVDMTALRTLLPFDVVSRVSAYSGGIHARTTRARCSSAGYKNSMSDTNYNDHTVAKHWDANADQWTADVRAGFDSYRDLFTWPAFKTFVGDVKGLDTIDLGCGEGTNTRRLAHAGARMTGIDLSERLIDHARQSEETDPVGIVYHVGSYSHRAPFPDASFDLAISTLALMDGPDLAGAMREAYRLLRPGGVLAFSVLHPCHISPGLRWEKGADGQTTGLVVDRYHDRSAFTERWRFGDRPPPAQDQEPVELFAVPRFPRTLSDWINAVLDAGLAIERVEEPRPDEAAICQQPRFARWRDHAAFLLLLRARRPA